MVNLSLSCINWTKNTQDDIENIMDVVYITNKGNKIDNADKCNEMFTGRQSRQDVKLPRLDAAVCPRISLNSVAAKASKLIIWINVIYVYMKK